MSAAMDIASVDRRNKLVMENRGLAFKIAKQFFRDGMDFEDLCQSAMLGLMRAAEDFDESRGYQFSTYASYWVKNSVRRYIAMDNTVHVPYYAREVRQKVWLYRMHEEMKTGVAPSLEDAVSAVKHRSGQVSNKNALLICGASDQVESMDAVLKTESEMFTLHDKLTAHDDPSRELEDADEARYRSALFEKAMNGLSERFRDVMVRRLNGETFEQIGRRYNLSRERIRQIQLEATEEIRAAVGVENNKARLNGRK